MLCVGSRAVSSRSGLPLRRLWRFEWPRELRRSVENSRVVDSGPKLNTIDDETFAVKFETNESEAVEFAAKLVGI